jgi:hypothetical protein
MANKKQSRVRRLAGTIKRKCKNPRCKKEFEAKNAKGVYCSAECRAQDFYFNKKEADKPKPSVRAVKSTGSVKKAHTVKSLKLIKEPVKMEISRVISEEVPTPNKKTGPNLDYLQKRREMKR